MAGPNHENDTVDRETIFTNYKSIFSRQFVVSLIVECIGVMFFQILGATTTPAMGPFVNGFALSVWIYTAANISGGHLNPAVTFSVFVCGFYPFTHAMLYMGLQFVGAILGSLVTAGLVPGAEIRMGDGGPGCFDDTVVHQDLTRAQLFGWEVVMTFTLISCVYACGISKPGHGSHTPYAVGLALLCCAGSGGQYTGAALNPARVVGPLAVFKCGKELAWVYIVAQFAAAVLACSVFAFVSGPGPMFPFVSQRELELSWFEAVSVWLTGSPPARLSTSGRDNIMDALTAKMDVGRSVAEAQVAPPEGHGASSSLSA